MKATIAALSLVLAPILVPQSQTPPPVGAEPTRVVVLSTNRIAAESTEGRAVNQRLQQLAQRMAADIKAREGDGKTTAEDLQKLRQQSQVDFQNAQRQAQNDLRAKVNPVIIEIAAQHKANLVLNTDTAVVWAATPLDITSDVLNKLSAQVPK